MGDPFNRLLDQREEWRRRAEAAEARCARLEKTLREIASWPQPQFSTFAMALDACRHAAKGALSDTAQETEDG